jgi:prophage regulatory protein
MTLTPKENPALDRFVRRPEVEKITGLPCSTIYWLMNRGQFPKPYKLSARVAAWRASDLQAWVAARKQSPLGHTSN